MDTVTITKRTRNLGWGFSASGRHDSAGLKPPRKPRYVGTVKQILRRARNDYDYLSRVLKGSYIAEAWFYRGRRITQVKTPVSQYDDPYLVNAEICHLLDWGWQLTATLEDKK